MHKYLNDLVRGDRIKVIKEFKDFDHQSIPLGSEWTFIEYDYFIYDGGYTFSFKEGEIRIAEISSGEDYYVLSHADEFFSLVSKGIKDTWS